ncbi:IS3 family transposase [Thermosipho ferrireducens]|uniref:IS3 family transposase n=2 Tax=Thermotogae TaxID=188708 RepID=A0ABX7S962_9BACT|nr:IS3 family transposase [Thermosipho ferrireducens]QTA38498.1 IS3 family transposase [Thermosipho ferrireducens]
MAKKLSTEEKMAIILEGLRREKSVSQICREHGISQAQYYKWRDRFLEGAKEGLENGKKSKVKQLEEKIEELEKVIGKQTIVIETFKKNSSISRRREIVTLLLEKGFNVSEALRYLKINRSTYYYKPKGYSQRKSRRKEDDEKILKEINKLKKEHPYWGYRRIWAMLRKNGNKLNQKKVYRIMKENGLLFKVKHKKACRTKQKKIKPTRPREVLGIDMTKVYTRDGGWAYYIAVIDWYTRELLGSEISLRCRTTKRLKALDKAINKGYPEGVRGKGIILVSDNGSQPTSTKFLKECTVLGIKQIFTSYNNPKGNANTERYFRTYKEEVAWVLDNPNYEELCEKTRSFEKFYNEEYPHSALGYKDSKEEFEEFVSLYKSA